MTNPRLRQALMVAPLLAVLLVAPEAVALTPPDYESGIRHQVNLHRWREVRPGPCVDGFAERWARHVAATGLIAHRDQQVILTTCNGVLAGEVIARGFATPSATVQAWMGSPTHRAVITNSRYRRVGVGAVLDDRGRWVVVANFIQHP